MIEHLNNIISDIDLIKKSSKYNLENIDIKDLEDNINKLKKNIDFRHSKYDIRNNLWIKLAKWFF